MGRLSSDTVYSVGRLVQASRAKQQRISKINADIGRMLRVRIRFMELSVLFSHIITQGNAKVNPKELIFLTQMR